VQRFGTISVKTLAPEMNKAELIQPEIPDFYLPFGGKLNPKNRWVKLAAMMPWDEVEACYGESLSDTGMGAPPL